MRKLAGVAALVFLAFALWNAPGLAERAARAGGGQRAIEVPPLRDSWAGYFPVGNVISPRDLGTERFAVLARHFDILTAENHMKPDHLQAERGVWTFGPADRVVNAALDAGLGFHGHTLAWHQQSPGWMNHAGISRDQAIENLQTHVRTVVGHFRGRVRSWDVLNEAISSNPPDPEDWVASLRDTPWLRAIGPEYVEIAFRAAREADPSAVLYYNDYNMDNQPKAIAVYNMIRDINARNPDVLGRPLIDAVGMQGHYRLGVSVDSVRASMLRFASLGVQVSVTELDITAGDNHFLTDDQALQQGILYARLFSLFRENAGFLGRVTIWGLDDASSWRARQSPLLFDRSLRAKPAFFAALNPDGFLAERGVFAAEAQRLRADARFGSPSMRADDPLWQAAAAIPIERYIMAWPGALGYARVLWDERRLHVLVNVRNAEMNRFHHLPHEQDSVEVYLDETNARAGALRADRGDGQFRVSFANERTFNPAGISAGFESAAFASDGSYSVVMRIPFRAVTPREGMVMGFDLQINGASARGGRQSIAMWSDTSGNSWQDTAGYGELRLVR